MKSQLLQTLVVVVGKSHNPTILNPDFLSIRGIVPEAWGWTVGENSFSTPATSQVTYDNRVTVIVDHSKLQIVDPAENPESSRIVEIAKAYVETLPHIRYAAVGINFQSFVETDSPSDYLRSRFVKPGPWDNEAHPLEGVGLRFVYGLPDGGRAVLSLDAGQVEGEGAEAKTREGIIIGSNFHRDCQGYPAEKQVLEHLSQYNHDWMLYQALRSDLLSERVD